MSQYEHLATKSGAATLGRLCLSWLRISFIIAFISISENYKLHDTNDGKCERCEIDD